MIDSSCVLDQLRSSKNEWHSNAGSTSVTSCLFTGVTCDIYSIPMNFNFLCGMDTIPTYDTDTSPFLFCIMASASTPSKKGEMIYHTYTKAMSRRDDIRVLWRCRYLGYSWVLLAVAWHSGPETILKYWTILPTTALLYFPQWRTPTSSRTDVDERYRSPRECFVGESHYANVR